MTRKFEVCGPAAILTASAAFLFAPPGVAAADPEPYGSGSCIQESVWHGARVGNDVCATTALRARAPTENVTPNAAAATSNEPGVDVESGTWAAIAYSPTVFEIGYSHSVGSRETAENEALEHCFQDGGTDCRIAISASTGCMALANSGTDWTGGLGPTQPAAERAALQENGGGEILVSGCTGA